MLTPRIENHDSEALTLRKGKLEPIDNTQDKPGRGGYASAYFFANFVQVSRFQLAAITGARAAW
jgi:hypothetical protein